MRSVGTASSDVCEAPPPVAERLTDRFFVVRTHVFAGELQGVLCRALELVDEVRDGIERHEVRQLREVGVLQPHAHRLQVPIVVRVRLLLVRRVRALKRAARAPIVKVSLKEWRCARIMCLLDLKAFR